MGRRSGACRVSRKIVSGALVLDDRGTVVLALEQDLCEQEIRVRRVRIIGKSSKVVAVPAPGQPIAVCAARLLPVSMIVRGEVHEIGLQKAEDLGLLLVAETLPVQAARPIELDEGALGVQNEAGETAILIGRDDLRL